MVSPLLRPVGLLAGWIALLQSIVWWILSLLGILAYSGNIKPPINADPVDLFPNALSCMYFTDVSDSSVTCIPCGVNKLLNRDDVIIIVAIYFAASFLWFAITAVMLTNMHKQEWKYTRNILYGWTIVTGAICVLDFSVTVVFGVDYNTLAEHPRSPCAGFLSVPALMMSLAARGYVLWVFNVASVVYLARAALRFDGVGKIEERSSQGSSIISGMYQDPIDSVSQHNMGYQPTEYATPERGPETDGNTWSIQSPHVGSNLRDNPWNFPAPAHDHKPYVRDHPPLTRERQQPPAWDRQPTAWDRRPLGREHHMPRVIPVRTPQVPPPPGPPPSYIPDPDYDDYEDDGRNPSRQRKKFEPRPFDEIPRRSALKKHRSKDHIGRTAF
ncbi:uncharacterized protein [Anabrus simplex]|uniref:uncharacterized protein n=1 Tax=Anabrus simplex TaxID=316456 RepID=UPI0035A33E2E